MKVTWKRSERLLAMSCAALAFEDGGDEEAGDMYPAFKATVQLSEEEEKDFIASAQATSLKVHGDKDFEKEVQMTPLDVAFFAKVLLILNKLKRLPILDPNYTTMRNAWKARLPDE